MTFVRDLSIGAAMLASLAVLALRTLPDAPPADAVLPRSAAVPAAAAGPARVTPVPWSLRAGTATAPDATAAEPPLLRDRNGRVIDLHGQDVAGYLARRTAAARTGDARAAYEIYQAASLCATAGAALPDFEMPAERADAEAERVRVRGLCAGVSAAQVQERLAFLARAAEAGNRDARIDFFTEGPQGRSAGPDADGGDPLLLAAWQAKALGYLQQAGAQCDAFALGVLANAYALGQLGRRDPGMALAYAVAEGAARGAVAETAQLRERFGALLDVAGFDAALQAGGALARRVCPTNAIDSQ